MVNICNEFQITWTLASLFLPLWLFSGKGEKLFPDIDVAIPVNDTRDCWHQENGISSFVCHRAHKSRRQNTLGQVRSWTFEMSKLYEKVSHLTFPDNSVATSNCWSNLIQWRRSTRDNDLLFCGYILRRALWGGSLSIRSTIGDTSIELACCCCIRLHLSPTLDAGCLVWSNLGKGISVVLENFFVKK